jgi:hypothetical protein
VNRLIEAHSGSICDVSMQADGRTLITCGTSKRAINPYDPKSPFQVSNGLVINYVLAVLCSNNVLLRSFVDNRRF